MMASDSVSNREIQTAHFACGQNFFMLINSLNNTKKNDNDNKHPIEVIECLIESLVNWFEVYGKAASKQTDLLGKNQIQVTKLAKEKY